MVRKIPARKHKGVKDPLLQLARRNACPSINAAPSNPNEQELPKSVLEIQRLCQIATKYDKSGSKKHMHTRKKTDSFDMIDSHKLFDKDPKLPGMRRKDKGVPRIVQKPGEDDEAYFYRFSSAAQEFLNEVELENKYDVKLNKDFKVNKNNDEIKSNSKKSTSKKRKQSEIDESSTQNINYDDFKKNNMKKPKFLNSSKESGTKPNKRQRRKIRRALLRKEEHVENEDSACSDEEIDFTCLKDEVKFGEVAHRPPQFTVKPRGSELNSKPGTKDLLLKGLINDSKEKDKKKQTPKLSNAQKYFLEQERIRVVKAYRDMKAHKVKA